MTRASGIPEQARYDTRRRLWELCDLSGGTPHGRFEQWRPDGSRYAVGSYDNGKLHDKLQRFHPNGEIAWEGSYVDGRLEGEVVATACLEPTPERLRACCVPSGAWQMRTLYEQGRSRGDRFFDRQGRRLLSDGTLYPERPAELPDGAWFEEGSRRWVFGARDEQGRPHGQWRWWFEAGGLCEQGAYDGGKRSGSWRSFSADGRLLEEAWFEAGARHGAFVNHAVNAGEFLDPRIAGLSGHLDHEVPVGAWELRDAEGAVLRRLDLGALPGEALLAQSEVFQDVDAPRAPATWTSLAEGLLAQRQLGAALCALARHAARTGSADILREALAERTVALSPERGAKLVKHHRGSWVDLVHVLARGAEPAATLRALASALPQSKRAARDFIEAALLLAGPRPELLLSRALSRLEFAELRGALADAEAVEQSDPLASRFVRDFAGVLFDEYRFIPAEQELCVAACDQLPDAPEQPLSAVQAAIAKSALRLSQIRDALSRLYAESNLEPVALPPDLSHLVHGAAVELSQWQFTIEEEGRPITIHVDERLELDTSSAVALLSRARIEWIALCWLCWGAGLNAVAKPQSLEPPADFNRALGQAVQRYYRCKDQATTMGLRSRREGVPDFRWQKFEIGTLSGPLLQLAANEYLEQRAILFWLADPECQSPWQDDLRPA